MFDANGIRILNDDELHSASADRLQDIQRRLAGIQRSLTMIAVPLWAVVLMIALGYIRK